jgi:hypothetical protein
MTLLRDSGVLVADQLSDIPKLVRDALDGEY